MQGAVSSSPWPPDENSDPRQKLSVAGHPVTAFVRCDRHFSTDLCPGTHTSDAKRIYRTLALDGYARIDFRLSAEGVPYFLEANPNPEIAIHEEFAEAADYDGLDYTALLERILALGVRRAEVRG
jgi:hypothetical protein